MDPEKKAGDRRAVTAWCLYDFANSAFATTVMAAMFPPFFRSLAGAAGHGPSTATALWAYTTALALLIVALAAPVLGAFVDTAGLRKRFTAVFAGLGIFSTFCFVFLGDDSWKWASFLFILANVGFSGANVFYDSFLPHLAGPGEADRVSAKGYALGYLGGGILLVINLVWVLRPGWFGLPGAGAAVRLSFASVAVWWALFSVPFFRQVPEPGTAGPGTTGLAAIKESFSRLARTFREIRKYRELALFLLAFWIYNDGIGTIIKMSTAYGDEIGISEGHMIAALVLTQFIGIPCAFAFGALANKITAKKGVLLGLFVYAGISIGGFFMKTPLHFFLLAGAVGTVQGGTQALSRSLFSDMAPRKKSAEFFGFFSTSAKMAGIFGPLLFGLVSQLTGASRLSILSLVVFFLLGALILSRVDVEAGKRAAKDS